MLKPIIYAIVYMLMMADNTPLEVEILNHLEHRHGYVAAEIIEGGAEYDDLYLVDLEEDTMRFIESDDLRVGDPVTVWFYQDEPIRMMFGWR